MKRIVKAIGAFVWRHTRWFLAPVGNVLAAIWVLAGRPWVWVGIMPIREVKPPTPTKQRIGMLLVHALVLVGLNIAYSVFSPKEWSGWWQVNIGVGIWIALFAAALQNDFVDPLWTRRYLRGLDRKSLLEIPTRSLDAVFEFEPGRTDLRFSKDCKAWLKTNMQAKYGIYPVRRTDIFEAETILRVWFKKPDDAFAFKMRWL